MSGDSSGRRPEGRGRGRGRDPHRDRTRSRSRSRSPLSPGSRRGAERREAPERPSLEEEEPSDSGDEMVDPASLEEEPDHGLCRQIRHQYRALINSVQRKAGRGARAAQGQVRDAGPAQPGGSAAPGLGCAGGGAPRAPTSVVPIERHDLGGGTQVPAGQDGTAGGQAPAVTRLSPDSQEEGRHGAQTPGSFSCTGAVPRCDRQPSSGSVT